MRRLDHLAIAAFFLAGLLSLAAALAIVDRYETSTANRLAPVLVATGHEWAQITPDGTKVGVSGQAPDQEAVENLINILGVMVAANRLVDETILESKETGKPAEFSLQILRNGSSFELGGKVGGDTSREFVKSRIQQAVPDAIIEDMTGHEPGTVPANWSAALEFGLDKVALLPDSVLTITPGSVEIVAIVQSADQVEKLRVDLLQGTPLSVEVDIDLRVPLPVVSPFAFRASLTGEQLDVHSCTAEDIHASEQIATAARLAGAVSFPACKIGNGSPHPRWADIVEQAVAALSELGKGTITINDTHILLESTDGLHLERLDKVMETLAASIPEEFTIFSVVPPSVTDVATGRTEAGGFRATLSPEGLVQLSGYIPDEESLETVKSFAQALFNTEVVHDRMGVGGHLPVGWPAAVHTSLEALAQLRNGHVEVVPDYLLVRGVAISPDVPGKVHELLSSEVANWNSLRIEVEYDEVYAKRPEQESDPVLEPTRCEFEIAELLAKRPIEFSPGSASLDVSSLDLIDAIAEKLLLCPDTEFEVQGHTDNQGRAEMNTALSENRATQVVIALAKRRVSPERLKAKGYGEDRPIADNSTEEGRRKNRRITFRAQRNQLTEGAEDE